MAKQRMMNTKFWSDPWVVDCLNPLDRYLFIYFLTNEHTNVSGIYELSLKTMCSETGLDMDNIVKVMIPRFHPKMIYENGWVILTNFPRHQNLQNPSIVAGIKRELQDVPKEVQSTAYCFGYPFKELGLSDEKRQVPPKKGGSTPLVGTLNLTKPNLPVAALPLIENEDEELNSTSDEEMTPSRDLRNNNKPAKKMHKQVFGVFAKFRNGKYPPHWAVNRVLNDVADRLFHDKGLEKIEKALSFYSENKDHEFCPKINTPRDLEEKWDALRDFRDRLDNEE